MPDYQRISLNATVPEHLEGERLDFIAAESKRFRYVLFK